LIITNYDILTTTGKAANRTQELGMHSSRNLSSITTDPLKEKWQQPVTTELACFMKIAIPTGKK
jgi:transcription-repair coupling factor (superfamily II helicase)